MAAGPLLWQAASGIGWMTVGEPQEPDARVAKIEMLWSTVEAFGGPNGAYTDPSLLPGSPWKSAGCADGKWFFPRSTTLEWT